MTDKEINTNGGPAIEDDVNIERGDFVGRDKNSFGGTGGKAPGAGGGGGGASEIGAVGGEGGSGGEIVSGSFRIKDLLPNLELKIGRGGEGGENTSLGNILSAKGGKGGRAGRHNLLARPVAAEDISNGLQISAICFAEVVHIRNGLLYLLGANWEFYEIPSVPYEVQWPLACIVSMGNLEPGTFLEFQVVVKDPLSNSVSQSTVTVFREDARSVASPVISTLLRFTVLNVGVWEIHIISGKIHLASLSIEIRQSSVH